MPTLPGPFDLILADLPYGTTACKWDTVIPFDPLWAEYKRLIKPRGAVVLFGSQPFTSALVMSNVEWFKHETIWHKTQATGHLNAWVMPMREHENVLVFGNGRITYNPQLTDKDPMNIRPVLPRAESDCYGAFDVSAARTIPKDQTFPRSVVCFANPNHGEGGLHPTQKPVALLEYLIRTYTNEGEVVLDNVMGSGSCGVAAVNTGRDFVGIEMDAGYFAIAQERIAKARQEHIQMEMAL